MTQNARVLEAARLLRSGEAGRCGPLLSASHASLRDDFEVSWPQADAAVEAATAVGALGARMTGGGFGGSVIALAEARRGGDVRAAVLAAAADRPLPRVGAGSGCACHALISLGRRVFRNWTTTRMADTVQSAHGVFRSGQQQCGDPAQHCWPGTGPGPA